MLIPNLAHAWASSPERLAIAVAVTMAFAALARALRGVNLSGALAGGLACFLLFAGLGPGAFGVLVTLFVLTWVSTRLGYRRKQALGLAEHREGRDAWQVLANLAVAAVTAFIYSATGNPAWVVATVAALAEAATDTVASEIGQYRSSQALMITTWQRVPAGTDGGITMPGTIAGLAAGIVLAILAVGGQLITARQIWVPVVAGLGGMLIDSLLGATLQRRGQISNQTVNFLSTLAASAIAWSISTL